MRPGKPSDRRRQKSERGATIVVVALSFLALLGMGALTVDLGQLLTMRADAQRVADASALAGASAFRDFPDSTQARLVARERVMQYASANYVGNARVDTTFEVAIDDTVTGGRVRVGIRRMAVGGVFSRLLPRVRGRGNTLDTVWIGATATAGVVGAAESECVMPFAMPDAWNEATQDSVRPNRIQDSTESWSYDPAIDSYVPFTGNASTPGQTGYGSDFRNAPGGSSNDYGRQLVLQQPAPGTPGNAGRLTLWHFRGESVSSPGPVERADTCDTRSVVLGDRNAYEALPGNDAAAVAASMQNRVDADPGARWDGVNRRVVGSDSTVDWRNSPRVVRVALYSPDQLASMDAGAPAPVNFNNIALFFLEPAPSGGTGTRIAARFLYYAGGRGGPGVGSLVRTIRLVE